MAVVAQMADRVVVMYRGNLVEEGPVERIFAAPQEEYTRKLLAAVPRGEMRGQPAPEPMRLVGDARPPAPVPAIDVSARPMLQVHHLTTRFPVRSGLFRRTVANVHAVEDVSFDIARGQTLALVGESGCGESTCGRSVLQLEQPTSGQVLLDQTDIPALGERDPRRRAWADIQMVFQDPFASLNPYMRLGDQVAEPLSNYGIAKGSEIQDRVAHLFERVKLPTSFMARFPHTLSGGQRQRVAIARALAVNPKLIIADETVSALDVSVQAQVLNLMMKLQAELGISFLFISHDMAVVERVSHRVGVMYLGRLVEIGIRAQVLENPQHSYTKALLSAVPVADPTRRMIRDDVNFRPIPSPAFPVGHSPEPSSYDEVSPDHLVMRDVTA